MEEQPTIAHGLDLTCTWPLHGLRVGTGRAVEVIEADVPDHDGERVGEWDEIPGRRARTTVTAVGRGAYLVTIGSMARFLVDTDEERVVVSYHQNLPDVLRTTLLMSTPAALFLYAAGLIGLHAGAVEANGRALLISGTGGSGKTTLTTAFHVHGHRLLGEDLAAIDPAGSAHPGPALARLREASSERIRPALRDVTELRKAPGQHFYEIAPHRRGTGDAVPVAAVVLLDWGNDGPRLQPVAPALAIQGLWDKTFYLADGRGAVTAFDRLGALVDKVPVYRLTRPDDFSFLDATVDLLVSELLTTSSAG